MVDVFDVDNGEILEIENIIVQDDITWIDEHTDEIEGDDDENV